MFQTNCWGGYLRLLHIQEIRSIRRESLSSLGPPFWVEQKIANFVWLTSISVSLQWMSNTVQPVLSWVGPRSLPVILWYFSGYSGGCAIVVGSVVVTNLTTGIKKRGWDRSEVLSLSLPFDISLSPSLVSVHARYSTACSVLFWTVVVNFYILMTVRHYLGFMNIQWTCGLP